VTERVRDEKHIETRITRRRGYPDRRRSRRRGEEVGDNALVEVREQAVLEFIPGWHRLDDDAPLLGRLVGDTKTTPSRRQRLERACRVGGWRLRAWGWRRKWLRRWGGAAVAGRVVGAAGRPSGRAPGDDSLVRE